MASNWSIKYISKLHYHLKNSSFRLSLPLFWRERLLTESVNRLELLFQDPIDQSMSLEQRFALELFGDDHGLEFTAATVAHVADFAVIGLQSFGQLKSVKRE